MSIIDPATQTNAYRLKNSDLRLTSLCSEKFFELNANGEPTNPNFYNAFAKESKGSKQQEIALKFLAEMPRFQRWLLPLFDEACIEYTQEIISAKLYSDDAEIRSAASLYMQELLQNQSQSGDACEPWVQSVISEILLCPVVLESQRDVLLFLFKSIHNEKLYVEIKESWIKLKNDLNEQKAFTKLENLEGLNFSGFDFSGLDFSHSFLPNADLNNTDLTGTNFNDADVKNAKINAGTIMTTDTFSKAKNADKLILVMPENKENISCTIF